MSCIIAEKALDDAARAIHAEFFGQAVREEASPTRAKKATKKTAVKRRGARA